MRHLCKSISVFRPFFRNFSIGKNCLCSVYSADGVVRSQLTKPQLPNLTIDEFLIDRVDRWPEKTAIVCSETGRSYSFEEYRHLRERVAQAFCSKLGLKKGDVIATLLPNIPEYMTIFLASFHAGIVITSINPVYTADEIARQMMDCSAKALITLTTTYDIGCSAIRLIKSNTKIPVITIKHEKTDVTPDGAINFQELCDYNGPQVILQRPDPEDIALLPYSSGTSGLPKGVQLKHRNVVANLVQLQHEALKMNWETTRSHQDVIPVMAPLYHCYGMIPVVFNLFSEGCQCVLLPKYNPNTYLDMLSRFPANILHFVPPIDSYQDTVPIVAPIFHAYGMIPILFNMFSEGCRTVLLPKYNPNLYLDMLDKYSANVLHIVPPIVLMLINNENAKKHHLKKLRHAISAAAPLANSDIERFQEKFGNHIRISQYYGLTETGPVTHGQRIDRDVVHGSVGYTLSFTESKIVSVDDETKNLGPNETGHLLLRGICIMPGYHNNPKATEESFDKDGWFKTGDIAHYDEEGLFYITDRIKELIKVKGFQVAPAELEALIREHPDVDDVAVTAVPHEINGEAPKAFVVPRDSAKLKPEHVQEYVKSKAAKHKHLIGGVVFVDAIPKNPTGKILRRKLKDL